MQSVRHQNAVSSQSPSHTRIPSLSSSAAYLLHTQVLVPLELGYLRTLSFILVIAASVQFTEIMVRRLSPMLNQVLGIYIPLIATNCAVLGVALLNVQESHGFLESFVYGFGAAVGFSLVLVLFAGVRERIAAADVPVPFRGASIALVTAGLMALAFLGFAETYLGAFGEGKGQNMWVTVPFAASLDLPGAQDFVAKIRATAGDDVSVPPVSNFHTRAPEAAFNA